MSNPEDELRGGSIWTDRNTTKSQLTQLLVETETLTLSPHPWATGALRLNNNNLRAQQWIKPQSETKKSFWQQNKHDQKTWWSKETFE